MDSENKFRRLKECFFCTSAVGGIILIVFLIVLFFLCQVFEDQPTVTTSISLASIEFSGNNNGSLLQSSSLKSVTFNVEMELRNKHVNGGVNYRRTDMFLRYKGKNVDAVPIPSFHVGYKRRRSMNLTLRFASHSALDVSDINGGVLGLRTYVRFSGKGRILVYRVYPVWWANHDLFLHVATRSLSYTECDRPNQGKFNYEPICKT